MLNNFVQALTFRIRKIQISGKGHREGGRLRQIFPESAKRVHTVNLLLYREYENKVRTDVPSPIPFTKSRVASNSEVFTSKAPANKLLRPLTPATTYSGYKFVRELIHQQIKQTSSVRAARPKRPFPGASFINRRGSAGKTAYQKHKAWQDPKGPGQTRRES